MRIGIIGAGRVGLGLGTAFTAAGHDVALESGLTINRAAYTPSAGMAAQPVEPRFAVG